LASPPRILVVRLSALGDVVLAQPAILALRRQLPEAKITWLIDRRFRAVADAIPGIDVVAIGKPTRLADYLALWRQLNAVPFDLLLAMQANFRVNFLYAGLRIPRKIGFDRRRARDLHRWFINESIDRRDEHLLDGFNQFAARAGIALPPSPVWPPSPASDEVAAWWNAQKPARAHVVIHAGASKPERCWPVDRHAELARFFLAAPAVAPVLTGGNSPAERQSAAAFKRTCPSALDLTGKTNLAQLSHVIARAAAVVSPDTAAVHLARAQGVPVIGLYAVARPALSGPYQALQYTVDRYPDAVREIARRDPARVDWHFRVHQPGAMALISAAEVWDKLQAALRA
jgi:heptosyltransferase I